MGSTARWKEGRGREHKSQQSQLSDFVTCSTDADPNCQLTTLSRAGQGREIEALDLKKEQHGQLGMDLFASDGVELQLRQVEQYYWSSTRWAMHMLHDLAQDLTQDGSITGTDVGLKGPCNANWQLWFKGVVNGLRSESVQQYSRDRKVVKEATIYVLRFYFSLTAYGMLGTPPVQYVANVGITNLNTFIRVIALWCWTWQCLAQTPHWCTPARFGAYQGGFH
ncbi:hypothetical protein DFH08DRAFT_812922 [Mycena albidolilacea]|uniref:Uncharacterized protein n=1 Tax=Mycena albidolilacea TaxID=1033008 RepID=A0AAD6ZTB1_9AGAR|nr:hypothetical protein DFH08DRAFT_812922 [Mycena albidolilacea]